MQSEGTPSASDLFPARAARGAKDDLELYTDYHPADPALQAVFIRNTNRNRGIIASIRGTAPSELIVSSAIDDGTRRRWPLQFEVRLAPGADQVLGLSVFPLWMHVNESVPDDEDPVVRVNLSQSFQILGAYYRNPPFPDLHEDPRTFLYYYVVPGFNGYYTHFPLTMNLHPTRSINMRRFKLIPGGASEEYGNVGVLPGMQIYHQPQTHPCRVRIIDAEFSS